MGGDTWVGREVMFLWAHKGRTLPLSLTGSVELSLTHVKARIVCPSLFTQRESTGGFPWEGHRGGTRELRSKISTFGFCIPYNRKESLISTRPRTPFSLKTHHLPLTPPARFFDLLCKYLYKNKL